MLFGPIALLLPWIWYPLVEVFVGHLRKVRTIAGNDRLLFCLAIVPLGLFTAVSLTRPILPHWPLIGFLPLFPWLGSYWATRSQTEPVLVRRWLNFMAVSVVVMASAFLLQARFGVVNLPFRDPCIEISGWESVGQELTDRGLVDRPNTFLFTSHWFDSGQVAFAVRNRLPVACYRQGDARGFAYWSRPEDWLGMDAVLIDADLNNEISGEYEPYFRSITELPLIQMTRGGRPFGPVRVLSLFGTDRTISICLRTKTTLLNSAELPSGSRNF